MLDSTHDAAHRDQCSLVVRFVHIDWDWETRKVQVKESFLGFNEMNGHDAESTTNLIFNWLEKLQIPMENCRSQCYDNAYSMAGHLSGVQTRILHLNPTALFINCDNHSLNLVGKHAVEQEPDMINFFRIVDCIFNFFSRSVQRWNKLISKLSITIKSSSEPRWSSRNKGVQPIYKFFGTLIDLLLEIKEDDNLTKDTRARFLTQEFVTLLPFWAKILAPIDAVQKRLR